MFIVLNLKNSKRKRIETLIVIGEAPYAELGSSSETASLSFRGCLSLPLWSLVPSDRKCFLDNFGRSTYINKKRKDIIDNISFNNY